MADKRMFTMKIVDSDAFLDMPLSSQCLYFHLNMRADDDGFVNNPRRIQRMIGASDDDMKLLIAKRFLLVFESGVVVIKHWRMNNYLRKDRYTPTQYQEEFHRLCVKDDGAYTEAENGLSTVGIPPGIPDGNHLATQVRLGKDRLVQGRLVVDNNDSKDYKLTDNKYADASNQELNEAEAKAAADLKFFAEKIGNAWNKTGFKKARKFRLDSKRGRAIEQAVAAYGLETVLSTIERAGKSEFLVQSGRITLDWFLDPDNLQKVLEGNYDERWVKGEQRMGGTSGAGGEEAGTGRISEAELRDRKHQAAKAKWGDLANK